MSNQIASTTVGSENVNSSELQSASKGKGKAVDNNPQDMSMDEDDDSSDEETGAEEETHEVEEEDLDNMEEISTENIINTGRRTRGKTIDFAKAAEEAGGDLDDDEDDDDDFEEKEDDAMQE